MVRRPRFELSIRESKSRVLPAKLSPNIWRALLDSGQGNRKMPDLQLGAFDYFAKYPYRRLPQVMAIIGMLQATPRPIYPNGIWKINPHHLIFYLQRDIIGSPCWWAEWESNPHTISDTAF